MNRRLTKSHAVKDYLTRHEWKEEQEQCAACHRSPYRTYNYGWPVFETHHIVKQGRSDERCNFLYLCQQCHLLAEGHKIKDELGGYWPTLSIAHCLWLKYEANPAEFNAGRLEVLRHSRLPEPVRPPERFFTARTATLPFYREG